MDNLTHSLTGAALSKAGLERLTPLATATLVLAANAPDVDVLSYVRGEYFGLAFRRGITHGFPALVTLPFAVAGVMLMWDRRVRLRREPGAPPASPVALLALAFLGVATHPLLDWTNNYGMRWWLPFDGRWSYGDSLFIIDPWLWLALGSAVYLSRAWKRTAHALWGALAAVATLLIVGAPLPIGAKLVWTLWLTLVAVRVSSRPITVGAGRRRALALTGAGAVYISAMLLSSALASRDVRAAAVRAGILPVDAVMVAPLPADPFGSVVLIRSGDHFVRGSYRWSRRPRVTLDSGAPLPLRSAEAGVTADEMARAIDTAERHPDARHYLTWSRFPFYRVGENGGALRVRISDARYDARGGSLAGVEVMVPRAELRP